VKDQVDWFFPITPFGTLGRLTIVEEPGKMRVVAMVDSLTQWLLYPLHRFIFDKILRVIPEDGTFDQLAPVRALISKLQKAGSRECFSYDLSAATDRIPVVLQEVILGMFSTPEFAFHWRHLLTSRNYLIPRKYKNLLGGLDFVRYAVGQPMGAYSSWAMLALVHHAIVQFSARRAGIEGWFDLYAVLGDDVVIGHRGVALEYTRFMREVGVDIGFNKSIISGNLSLEFAKRFFYKGVEVTPVPLVAVAAGWLSINGIPEVLKASRDRIGKTASLFSIGKSLGFGFKAASRAATSRLAGLPRRLRSAVLVLSRPGASQWSVDTLWEWYLQSHLKVLRSVDGSVCEKLAPWFLKRLESRSPRSLRKRVWTAFNPFQLDSAYISLAVELSDWWVKEVKKPYMQPLYDVVTEYEALLEGIKGDTAEVSLETINDILVKLDQFETLAAKLPVKVTTHRDMKDIVQSARERFPKTVNMWRQVNKRLSNVGKPYSSVTYSECGGEPIDAESGAVHSDLA
jgi:hypothetical protein